jgi:hypothetical protein
VGKLGKLVGGVPLISMRRHETYTQYQIGKEYVMTHSNTKSKKEMLEAVANELGLQVSVEIVS